MSVKTRMDVYPFIVAGFLLCCQIESIYANLPPVFDSDLSPPLIKEDTPVGTPILTLAATDPEGGRVKYGLQGSDSLRVDSNSGVVTITKPLDREEKDTLRLVVTVEDEVQGADNNIVRVPLELVVLDVNDNPPVFSRNSFEVSVPENASVGSTVLGGVLLSDVDQVGNVLTVVCLDQGKPSEDFELEHKQMTSRSFRGDLVLKKELSYNRRRAYKLTLVASDGENMVRSPLSIEVKDVQDTPPMFKGSSTGVVSEDAPIGSLVMTLQAEDGDMGDPRRVMYELVQNPLGFFLLDPESGELRTAKPLDREAVPDPAGVLTLRVTAYETVGGVRAPGGASSSASVSVRVTIRDVNDEAPTFNHPEYRVFVPENLPEDTPVADLGMVITDTDVGSNSVFSVRLSDSSGRFSVSPSGASGSTSVSLRVSRGGLDYENPNERKFLLLVVAEESLTLNRLSSTATVVVQVTDTNDNSPVFAQEAYTAMVPETASGGTVVTSIGATDPDTGSFGTEGILYSLFGNGAERFMVDRYSGVITVSPCDTPGRGNCLDYETRPTYFLSLEATDEEGNGQTTVVPLRISLRDVNDNPPRFKGAYRAVIQEGARDFDPPLVVKAMDPDTTSKVSYSLAGGDPTGLFRINNRTGRIMVADPAGLDISSLKGAEIVLTVEANDGVGSHSAQVRVSVQDVNNNSPLFSEQVYEAAVQENAPNGTVVEVVMATDLDTGVNALVSYRIMKGAYDDFSIDPSSGEVFVTRRLNYDTRGTYHIEVLASDQGIPRMTSSAKLRITVIDNNDKNPYFVPTTQRVKVKEDTPAGAVIHTLTAEDLDVSSPGGLHFALLRVSSAVDNEGAALPSDISQDLKSLFTVSPTGQVSLTAPLNRNLTSELTLRVTVTDTTAVPPQTGEGYLVITVVDINDNPPTFPPPWSPTDPYIRVSISEELPLGSVVTAVTASDVDSNIGRYAFLAPSDVLAIDDVTGVVTVKGRLDYEADQTLNVTVVVTDTGVPQLSATATLVINLENINDEEPVFDEPIYDGEVLEHAPAGTPVGRVSALDRDKDHLGTITYSLAGDHKQYFVIDSSGVMSVAPGADLDREVLSEMRLRAVATDSGPRDTRRQTSVPVHIQILDVNDHPPRFEQEVFRASIVENLPLRPPVPVLQVKAVDEDQGINAALLYTVTGGTGKDLFRLDPTTGILYPARRLMAPENEETFDLDIEVRDMNGTGPTSDTARITVTVLPRNEHKPVFVVPAYPAFKVTVPEESSEPELLVLTVSATDSDGGSNGDVKYHLRVNDDNVQETETFRIDAVTGQLRTKVVLDREKIDKYELVLVAKDQGSPISYETLRVVTIVVEDVDDHPPSFPGDARGRSYTFAVTENLPKDTLVGQTRAHDPDLGSHARIFYYLTGGNIDSSFHVDKSNGNIFTSRPLDREHRPSYDLLLKVTNDPNYFNTHPLDPAHAHDMGEERDGSVALVTVTVLDENDSPPVFAEKTLFAGVSSSAEVGQMVRLVSAEDGDKGLNGSLVYSIRSSTFFRPGESKPVGSIVPSPFNLTKEGRLLTATPMDPYRRHRFLLQVQAKEEAPPHRVDTCQVNIWVWERDELIKVVFEQRPEEVVQEQELITAELSRVLEGRAVVDEVRYFTHANNSVSRDWTEMLMHVVNQSSDVIDTEEVLRRVDRGYPLLMKSEATSKIRNIYPALLSESKAEVDARMAGLIALVVALVLGLVSFMAVCCCLRFWVLSPAKSREHLIHRAVDDDLGLNTTENPLWVDQKLKSYEEQELSMQVMSEFDPSGGVPSPQGIINGGTTNSANLDAQSNTYATIQKSHGGTLRSLQLRGLHQPGGPSPPLILGPDPGETNDYATLDHLRRPNGTPGGRRGPRVPGVETPLSAVFAQERETPEIQELVTSFTGSTFQAPEPPSMANRPLPEEPLEGGARRSSSGEGPSTPPQEERAPGGNLTVNALGEPCLVAELI